MRRIANFQSISWFWDLYQRKLLDLEPPYQRRSVWNQAYKDYFIDTVLNGYPAPAIFLYQEISSDGISEFSVVDGKQRLSTIFEFAKNEFPLYEKTTLKQHQGKYFKDLDDETKKDFWGYQFSVEYLPSSDEGIINTIFDRINRNVAKLSFQELRHAQYDGEFITKVEELNDWMFQQLPQNFPSISQKSRKQMKDVEFTAQLILMLENGPGSYSQSDLDRAFSERDDAWEAKNEVETYFRELIALLKRITHSSVGQTLARSRLRNQADFYSLVGAVHEYQKDYGEITDIDNVAFRLLKFAQAVDNEETRANVTEISSYFEAARSASNDTGPRRTRIKILKNVIQGSFEVEER